MRLETKIATLLMLAALAMSSCTKKTITPAEDPQPAEVGFTAASQAVWVKSAATKSASDFPHPSFGVWGIARQGSLVYNLWGNDALMDVNKNTAGSYVPSEAAYWLKGYTYNFLAVAPCFEDEDEFSLTPISPSTSSGDDIMTFTFDMSSKYATDDYSFDLLGAAAEQEVTSGGYSTAQELVFWHLLSQIEIKNIGFSAGIAGTVTKVHLKAFPSGEYTISYDNSTSNLTAPTKATCCAITENSANAAADKSDIIVLNPNFSSSTPIINIIPQKVEYLELYIDFTINEGTTDNPILVEYQGFKIDLTAQELDEYVYNGKYNWSITIGTKNTISFEVVKVNDWKTGNITNEFPLQ